MSQGSPPRIKIAGLFLGESPMSLALTTTHENGYFQRSIPPFFETRAAKLRQELWLPAVGYRERFMPTYSIIRPQQGFPGAVDFLHCCPNEPYRDQQGHEGVKERLP